MTKLVLTDLVNLENEQSAIAAINANNAAIEAAIENTLSRDGTSPNAMTDNLDMNSKKILNLPAASSNTEPVRKAEFDAVSANIANANATVAAAGASASAAATSASQAAASAASAAASAAIAGSIAGVDLTPYMQKSQNLNDLANKGTARTNLSVYSKAEVDTALSGKSDTSHTHTSAGVTDFTEAVQDVVGAMVTAAGGSYNDAAGTITLPTGTRYTSASTAVPNTANTPTTFTHGLGSAPAQVWVVLECASAELGYSVGDIVPISLNNTFNASSMTALWWGCNWDATTITVTTPFGSAPAIVNKNTSQYAYLTQSKWNMRVRAIL